MSGSYYRVIPEPIKYDGYGFKKVSHAQLAEIIERVSKATYSTRVQTHQPDKIHNYARVSMSPPPRTPSACRRRVSVGSTSGKIGQHFRVVDEHELQRVIRRVRKPTKASELSRRDYDYDHHNGDDDSSSSTNDVTPKPYRPVTATERKKAFDQMSRPTTASRAKRVMDCHLCDEQEVEANKNLAMPFYYPYADDQSVSHSEVPSIISRISSPTKASQRGATACWCSPPNLESVHCLSENLPLVSGMGRSRSVNQIVNRLHHTKGTYRKMRHGYVIKATPVTDFNEQSRSCQQVQS